MSNSFLGTGWGFPPTFNKIKNGVQMVSEEEDIRQSLLILFQTGFGERIMQPEYGSELTSLMFESVDRTFEALLIERIKDAILYQEPRIDVDDITINNEDNQGKVQIEISFTVRQTNSRSNIVFPFYFIEGTNI